MSKTIKLLALMGVSLTVVSSCGGLSYDPTEGIVLKEPATDNNTRSYYEIFVASFRDSDGDGIGDLKGVTEKIPYVKSLGFRGIWLMPIFASPSYHKYNVSDFYKIDQAYGIEEDLKELVRVAHENNIKVILDLALNHSSRSNPLFEKAVAAHAQKINDNVTVQEEDLLKGMTAEEIDFYASLYSFYDDKSEVPSTITAHLVSGHSFYYEGNFDVDMPEFNFDSKLAQETFKNIIDYWMDPLHGDVDGYRLDAVIYYYKGDSQKNFLALDQISKDVKAKKADAYVVGEAWENSTSVISDYYKDTGIDSYFYFPGQGPNGMLGQALNPTVFANQSFLDGASSLQQTSNGKIPAPFIDNHDTNRFTRSQLPEAKFLYGLFSTLSGNTFTYYGDEIGIEQTGQNDPSKRTAMAWGEGNIAQDPEGSSKANLLFGTVQDQRDDRNSLLNFVSKANAYRLAYPLIGEGVIDMDESKAGEEDYLLTIVKKKGDEKLKILYNFSRTDEASMALDFGERLIGNLVTNDGTVNERDGKVNLPPRSIAYVR